MEVAPASRDELPSVRALLEACGLDASDVDGEAGQRLLVARAGGTVVGCVGLEPCGEVGLLRSLAVAPEWRRRGTARALQDGAMALARRLGLRTLYIRTATIRDRALRDGFVDVPLADVPAAIRAGRQFQGACPASAASMRLDL